MLLKTSNIFVAINLQVASYVISKMRPSLFTSFIFKELPSMMRIISPLFAALLLLTASFVQAEELKFPGKESTWNGFKKYDFEVDGKQVLVVTPKKRSNGKTLGLAWRIFRSQTSA